MTMADLSEEELQALYCWIDEIPLSRTKKNISRDFSDAGSASRPSDVLLLLITGLLRNLFNGHVYIYSTSCSSSHAGSI